MPPRILTAGQAIPVQHLHLSLASEEVGLRSDVDAKPQLAVLQWNATRHLPRVKLRVARTQEPTPLKSRPSRRSNQDTCLEMNLGGMLCA